MEKKLARLLARFDELEQALADPSSLNNPKLYRDLTREHSHLSELKSSHEKLEDVRKNIQQLRTLLKSEEDSDMVELLKEELSVLEKAEEEEAKTLEILLIPPDPTDSQNVIMELRAGTGGDEAAIFVGDCVRMYQLYAQSQGWRTELLSCSPSEMGGFKEFIMVVSGLNVKRMLQYEGGTHRVQRVPKTESQGRIHTSAITIAVMTEPSEEEEIKVDEKDLKIDTYRSSGAGGQHVNTTDSAVRITHIPTGIAVYCQEERSQHKNKDKAMRFLKAKLAEKEQEKRKAEEASLRASQVGSGDRSERIRTYNFPQNRVTDHRIEVTWYNLDRVMEGLMNQITNALVAHFHQKQLAES